MIQLQDVGIAVGTFRLFDLSITIEAGQYAVMMGKTGQGKTTILETICGLQRCSTGKIMVDHQDVTDLPPRHRGIGYVPQDVVLFPTMTVRDHLRLAMKVRGEPIEKQNTRAQQIADELGLTDLLDRYPSKLSGGEAQRVSLGRAVAFRPRVLLLDEPLSALDEATRTTMQSFLRRLNRDESVTVLHVTHDSDEADAVATVQWHLDSGRLDLCL